MVLRPLLCRFLWDIQEHSLVAADPLTNFSFSFGHPGLGWGRGAAGGLGGRLMILIQTKVLQGVRSKRNKMKEISGSISTRG